MHRYGRFVQMLLSPGRRLAGRLRRRVGHPAGGRRGRLVTQLAAGRHRGGLPAFGRRRGRDEQRDGRIVCAAVRRGAAARPQRQLGGQPFRRPVGDQLGQVGTDRVGPRVVRLRIAVSVGREQDSEQGRGRNVHHADPEFILRADRAQARGLVAVQRRIAGHREQRPPVGPDAHDVAVADLGQHEPFPPGDGQQQGGSVGNQDIVVGGPRRLFLRRERLGGVIVVHGLAPARGDGGHELIDDLRPDLVGRLESFQPYGQVPGGLAGDFHRELRTPGAAEMTVVPMTIGDRRDQQVRPGLAYRHGILVGQAGQLVRGPQLRGRQAKPVTRGIMAIVHRLTTRSMRCRLRPAVGIQAIGHLIPSPDASPGWMAAHATVPARRTSPGPAPESVMGAFKQTRSLLSPWTELLVRKARCRGETRK